MLKRLLRILLLRERADSDRFVSYLRRAGAQVGECVRFYAPSKTHVDVSCPWLLSIGGNVNIAQGVTILTHDYSWAVMKRLPGSEGAIYGAQSPVKIGNNVFIGMNAIITRGVCVGDNVVIGAGSVVTKDCESNSVYAGNPARKIMTMEEFREKRRERQFREAKALVLTYRERFHKEPPMEVFTEYFPLFSTAEAASRIPAFRRQMETGGNYDTCFAHMRNTPPMFDSYEAFLEACV